MEDNPVVTMSSDTPPKPDNQPDKSQKVSGDYNETITALDTAITALEDKLQKEPDSTECKEALDLVNQAKDVLSKKPESPDNSYADEMMNQKKDAGNFMDKLMA